MHSCVVWDGSKLLYYSCGSMCSLCCVCVVCSVCCVWNIHLCVRLKEAFAVSTGYASAVGFLA